jgi:chromate reductase
MTVHVLAVPGSLRSGAFTTALLQRYLVLLGYAVPEYDITVNWSQHISALPAYNADLDNASPPTDVVKARLAIARADVVVIATPQYNGSIPGGLKNWLDWTTRPPKEHALVDKPTAVIGGSPNRGGARTAIEWLHTTLGLIGARITAEPLSVPYLDQQLEASDTLGTDLFRNVEALVSMLHSADVTERVG